MVVFWNYTFIELSVNYQFPPPLFAAKLLLTPMKHMVVPPPMSAHTIELPSPASIVSFGPSHLCNDMAVLLSNGCVAIYKSLMENGIKEEFKPPGKVPTHVATYRCYSNSISYTFFFKFERFKLFCILLGNLSHLQYLSCSQTKASFTLSLCINSLC